MATTGQWLQNVAIAIVCDRRGRSGRDRDGANGALTNRDLANRDVAARDRATRQATASQAMTSAMAKTAKGRRGPAAEKLPAEGTQARRFGKTRSAQSTALLEDYVELIADLLQDAGEARPTDIARRLGVSHATAIKTIARLKRAGLATARPYRGVFLTEKGEAMAERVRIRHRLVVDVLCALGVPTESAEADAEGIEHHVSETTLKAFAHFVKSQR
jgi:DtxR family manganese transport transcriptional regulator